MEKSALSTTLASDAKLQSLKQLKGIIFDLDNTLVSSSLNFPQIRATLGCPDGEDVLGFISKMSEKERQKATKILVDFEMADASSSTALDGCHQLIDLIKQLGLRCAIVTRNCQQAAKLKIKNNDIAIADVITREQFSAKPSPEALLYLAHTWKTPTQNIMYVGDFLYDIQAAKNAQMISCLLTFDRQLAYSKQADIAIKNLPALYTCLKQAKL